VGIGGRGSEGGRVILAVFHLLAGRRLNSRLAQAGAVGDSTVWLSVGGCDRTLADLMLTLLTPCQAGMRGPFPSFSVCVGICRFGSVRTDADLAGGRVRRFAEGRRRSHCRLVVIPQDSDVTAACRQRRLCPIRKALRRRGAAGSSSAAGTRSAYAMACENGTEDTGGRRVGPGVARISIS
jgi:hypothetical protein